MLTRGGGRLSKAPTLALPFGPGLGDAKLLKHKESASQVGLVGALVCACGEGIRNHTISELWGLGIQGRLFTQGLGRKRIVRSLLGLEFKEHCCPLSLSVLGLWLQRSTVEEFAAHFLGCIEVG